MRIIMPDAVLRVGSAWLCAALALALPSVVLRADEPPLDAAVPVDYQPQPPPGAKNPATLRAEAEAPAPPPAAPPEGTKPGELEPWYSAHAQATVVPQGNWKFTSPYVGPNSLLPILSYRTTATATLYLAARLWQGGEVLFNPEMAGGTGLSNTTGLAAFPNGEATRVGEIAPTPYVARLLLRQTFGLGGDTEKVEDAPNEVAGERDVDRISISIGKMSAEDFIDDNHFSHDPRTQFLNWSIMYTGAWDYPANVRGYTYGGLFELNTRWLAFRYGVFAEPSVANGAPIDPHILKANGHIIEEVFRYEAEDHPGAVRLWAYLNHAHMGKYRDALAQNPAAPDVTLTRMYRIKYGFGMSWDQEITPDLGVFARLGWNDGKTESWAFTEIDEMATVGLLLKGTAWRRPQDEVGLALLASGLSNAHKDYLADGGLGFIIGDGKLRYGGEQFLETYYNCELRKNINVTVDFQGVEHPAYNKDRGPVAILAVRFHLAY